MNKQIKTAVYQLIKQGKQTKEINQIIEEAKTTAYITLVIDTFRRTPVFINEDAAKVLNLGSTQARLLLNEAVKRGLIYLEKYKAACYFSCTEFTEDDRRFDIIKRKYYQLSVDRGLYKLRGKASSET